MDILIDPYRYKASFTLTSLSYPVEVVESVNTQAAMSADGRSQLLQQPSDEISTSANLVDASLIRVIGYRTQDAGFDSVDTSATLTAGSLTRVIGYVTQDAGLDSVDTSATLLAGSLQRVIGYVTYNIEAESVDTSATLIGGTLV